MLNLPYIPKVENLEQEIVGPRAPVEIFENFQCIMDECNASFQPEIIILDHEFFSPVINGYFSCPKCGTWYSVKLFSLPETDMIIIGDTNLMAPSKQFAAR